MVKDKKAIKAAICACLFLVAVYFLAVWTPFGQGLENDLLKRADINVWIEHPQYRPSSPPPILSSGQAVVAGIVLILVALIRRRMRLVLWAVVALAGSGATALLLKVMLPRPVLDPTYHPLHNSAPSGHVAMATAVAITAMVVSPSVFKYVAAAAGVVVATLTAYFVQSSSWHRPSDVLMGVAVSLSWALLASAVIPVAGDEPRRSRGTTGLLLAGLIVPAAIAMWWASGKHVNPGFLVIVSSAAPCAAVAIFALHHPRLPSGSASDVNGHTAEGGSSPATRLTDLVGTGVLSCLVLAAPFALTGQFA
ncbi:phosphatase PAP2 family protein [Streptomyces sp. NPDC008343]|uniref:phosphatase PAP2 family protein n=1 Tax=Streptomyces sp. NPDC008343 TaxID=3364828 RepID=UPI0036E6C3E6